MNGFLLIDKPVGITSNDAVAEVRSILEMGQVGHSGTLDREASGLLGIMVGDCTRLVRYLHLGTHDYRFRVEFGRQTDTLDVDGEVVNECAWDHLTAEAIESGLETLRGDIEQVPPVYSAVKVDGERASDRARRGEEVDLKARSQRIDRFELVGLDLPQATFEARCSAGTYIRALVRDLADALETCATTTDIRRMATGPFRIEDAAPLDELTRKTALESMLPPRQMMAPLPELELTDEETERVGYGQRLPIDDDRGVDVGDYAALISPEGILAGVGEIIEGYEGPVIQPRTVLETSDA
jgi:tRNA pseudouridine55 synthase